MKTRILIVGLGAWLVSSITLAEMRMEIEEVDTPNWIIDETEYSIIENRPAVYNAEEFIVFEDGDDTLPPLDEDSPFLPSLDTAPPAVKRPIPSMSPKGTKPHGTSMTKPFDPNRKEDPKKAPSKKADSSPDPFAAGDDAFPPVDTKPGTPNDPFPPINPKPGDPNDPFPPAPGNPNDPFPPITDPIGGGLPGWGDPFFPDPGFGFGGSGPVVILDQLVNLGHKVWKIIEQNQPVIKADYKYANAVPKGADATDLEFFSSVQYKSFRIKLKNRFDADVVDVTYTTVHRYGGKYEGRGHFLERVSIVPSRIVAGYNYKVNFDVINVTVANVGSKEEPIASMGVDALIEYGSTFKKTSRRILFEFRGDSAEVKQYRVD